MAISIRCYKGKKLVEGARIALKNRLYAYWRGGLQISFQDVIDNSEYASSDIIMIAFDDSKPVGASVVHGNFIELFTRVSYRRQGIGKRMYRRAMKVCDRKDHFEVFVTNNNYKFFMKVGAR